MLDGLKKKINGKKSTSAKITHGYYVQCVNNTSVTTKYDGIILWWWPRNEAS